MPWSGGVFTRTNGVYTGSTVWNSDKAAGVKIVSGRHDTHDQDLAQGINNCLAKDGTNAMTANIQMAGYRLVGLSNGANPNESATFGQTITAITWETNTILLTRAAGNLSIVPTLANITAALGFTPFNAASAGTFATKNQTVSTAAPSGTPADGAVWFRYTP